MAVSGPVNECPLLPRGTDDASIAAHLRAAGIACSTLSAGRLERPRQGGLILGYGGVAGDQIDESVRRLARVARHRFVTGR